MIQERVLFAVSLVVIIVVFGVIIMVIRRPHRPVYMVETGGRMAFKRWAFRVTALTPTLDPTVLKVGAKKPVFLEQRVRCDGKKHTGRFRLYFHQEIVTGHVGVHFEDVEGTVLWAKRELTEAEACTAA